MRYISIDIETTGLDRENHQILSVGALIEDTERPLNFEDMPKFHVAIKRKELFGSTFALNLNRDLIQSINHYMTAEDDSERFDLERLTGMKFVEEKDVAFLFHKWLAENGFDVNNGPIKITPAGKNFGSFDKQFLESLPSWNKYIRLGSRELDPSIIFINWRKDEQPPSLSECKKRAGFGYVVTHNALEDAFDIVELLRKEYD